MSLVKLADELIAKIRNLEAAIVAQTTVIDDLNIRNFEQLKTIQFANVETIKAENARLANRVQGLTVELKGLREWTDKIVTENKTLKKAICESRRILNGVSLRDYTHIASDDGRKEKYGIRPMD